MSNYWLRKELEDKMDAFMVRYFLGEPLNLTTKRSMEDALYKEFGVIVKVNYLPGGVVNIRYVEEGDNE